MIREEFFSPTNWKRDWKLLLAVGVVVFAVSFGFRCMDYPSWNHEQYKVGDEFIMGTHDAYYWLAGAVGVGHATDTMMAAMPRVFSEWTGVSVGLFGFWAPAVFASLVAVVVALWAWTLGGLPAGLCAGVLAALAPGFYFRTRLGYYDSDIATLLFPLLMGWALAHWLQPRLEWPQWLRKRFSVDRGARGVVAASDERSRGKGGKAGRKIRGKQRAAQVPAVQAREDISQVTVDIPPAAFWLPVVAGLFVKMGWSFHSTVSSYAQLLLCMAVVLIFLLGKKGQKPRLLWGAVIFALVAFVGWLGLAISLGIIFLDRFRPGWFAPCTRLMWPVCIVLGMIFISFDVVGQIFSGTIALFSAYIKPLTQSSAPGGGVGAVAAPMVYPSITQSVIEAQNLPLGQVLVKIYPWTTITAVGILGFGVVLVLRPSALFLLPFGVFALAAVKMGARTTMFGGPVFALGLALPLAWAARRYLPDRSWRMFAVFGVEAGLLVLLLVPYRPYFNIPITPILSKEHCLALKALEPVTPKNSRIWTWWDWGYATQYYARRMSFADGARHDGGYIFPLGVALTTPNPKQSSQLMEYTATVGYEPWKIWNAEDASEVVNFLRSLSSNNYNFLPKEKQYLVVAKENYPLIPWISFYGTWNLVQKNGTHAFSYLVAKAFSINTSKGTITYKNNNKEISLRSIDILTKEGVIKKVYNNGGRRHAVVDQISKNYYIFDDVAYNSMMVQLLISSPEDKRFTPFFKLVYEGFPFVRIYEVL